MAAKKKGNPNPGGRRKGHGQWSRRNFAPVLFLTIDGKPADDLLGKCIKFVYKRSLGKSAEMKFVFRNDERKLLDDKRLFPNNTWNVRFGYFDDLSPILTGIIRQVEPVYADRRTVTVTLYDALLNASTKSQGKNWKKVKSSEIAKQIAKAHGWNCVADDSKDVPAKAWIQPNDVNDIRFLRDLAAMIDFEVYLDEGTPLTLYYRKKAYDEGPKDTLVYYDDQTEYAYVKSFTPKVKSLGPIANAVAAVKDDKGKKDTTKTPKGTGLGVYYNLGDQRLVVAPASVKKEVAKPAPKDAHTKNLAEVARQQMLDKCNEADSDHPLTPSITAGDIFEWGGIEKQLSGKWYAFEVAHEMTGRGSSTKVTWKRNATNKGDGKNKNTNNKNAQGQQNKNGTYQYNVTDGSSQYVPPKQPPPPAKNTPQPVAKR